MTILESTDVVGGISQTVQRDGWRFDIGGHRFFTKVRAVNELWDEILAPETMLNRPRQSRILYRGQALRLPAGPDERAAQPGPDRGGPLRRVRTLGSRAPAQEPGQPRRFLRVALRLAAVPPLLQDLHREGVGRAGHRDLRRLGRAAREGPLDDHRGVGGAEAEARSGARDASQRYTSLIEEFKYPEVRSGDDVGDRGREGDRGRRDASTSTAGSRASSAAPRARTRWSRSTRRARSTPTRART